MGTFLLVAVLGASGLFVVGCAIGLVASIRAARRRERRMRLGQPSSGRLALERMKTEARPGYLLTQAQTSGFSKLGGLPELTAHLAWPAGDLGLREFLLQVDFAEVEPRGRIDWLPGAGRLYAFVDREMNGAADCVKVLFDQAGGEVFQPTSADVNVFAERRISFTPFISAPSVAWLKLSDDSFEFDDEDVPLIERLASADVQVDVRHQLGGYPREIQGGQLALESEYISRGSHIDPRKPVAADIRRASEDWRLLLQVDSDDALGMNWWDAGRLYIFVRESDARRLDFSQTVTITQFH